MRQGLEEDVKYRPKTGGSSCRAGSLLIMQVANMQAKSSPTERQKGSQASKISGAVHFCDVHREIVLTEVCVKTDFMQTHIPKVASEVTPMSVDDFREQDEVKILEEEILEEILHLRRQYKDICAQVQ